MCGMRKLRTLDIVDYVKAKKRCTLAHLMQKFKVSSATIHRDVAELVAAGHLERVRGGGAPAKCRPRLELRKEIW